MPDRDTHSRTMSIALLVFLGCFLGAWAGGVVRMPEIGTAVVFPPYAVLTAALLLTPSRDWWIYLLAAVAGDYLPHQRGEGSATFVLLAEVANVARALIAAGGVRLLCGRRSPFHTLRDMVVFLLFAAVLGPAVGASIGAADVVIHSHEAGFRVAWQAWMLSNTLTGLTLLPMILIAIWHGKDWFGRTRALRLVEGALLLTGLCLVGYGLLTGAEGGSKPWSLYGPLPFLVWAAVRFGPGGTVIALAALTTLTIGGAIGGHGPFVAQSAPENLLQLQLFVIAVAIPILLLSALVHQHAETEAALRQSQAQYRSIVEDQSELICRFLPDGTYTFVNGAYCRYFGYTPEELIGRKFFMFIPAEHHRATIEVLDGITPDDPQASNEHLVLAPGGQQRWHQWTNRGLFDREGRLIEYQAVGRDITEKKRAEEEHRQLEAQARVQEALREADRRKDEFLAMLAHELRNPLAPIYTALEILRLAPPGGEQARWAQGVIGRQAGQLTRLVDDLLDVSRITRGKIRLEMDRVDLSSVVAQAVETSRPLIESRNHELHVTAAPVLVLGDFVRLSQVIANLLHNAAKYTDPGGRVEVLLEEDGPNVLLRVRDNGIGIAPEMLEHVFELFAQAEASRGGVQGGLGIGLTLVRRLVELHGGEVTGRSGGPGTGSEFIVRLPTLATSAAVPSADGARAPVVVSAPLRVLVVDDNVDAAGTLTGLLGHWGHTVHVVHDGEAALHQVSVFAPDAVLLDLGLPGLDGMEVARQLRDRKVDRPILLVAITGFGRQEDRHRTTDAGFDHHFTKPVDIDALRSLLATHGDSRFR